MNAHVLPFPFVPATWMIFRPSMSADYCCQHRPTSGYKCISTECPSWSSHCLIPTMLGVPLRSDSPFRLGIRLKLGKLSAGCMRGLLWRRHLSKTSMALCSKLDMAKMIEILLYLVSLIHCVQVWGSVHSKLLTWGNDKNFEWPRGCLRTAHDANTTNPN